MATERFPFGSNDPYYSRREPESQVPQTAIGLTGLLASGGALFGAGFIPTQGGGNVFDTYYKAARVASHTTPMGLLATLRIPEMISPFTSTGFQSGGAGPIRFTEDYLRSPETLNYLSRVTGLSEPTLEGFGVGKGAEVTFERMGGTKGALGQGRLTSKFGSSTNVLSENIMMLERSHTSGDIFSPRTNINQFAEGVGAVVSDRNLSNAFVKTEAGKVVGAHRWMPVPSITGSTSSIGDFWNRVTYLRGYAAFEAQRPIKAIETMTDNIPVFGEALQPLMKRLGMPKGSTAIKTYLGLGGFAAKIAAAGIAVDQYNWFLRYQADDSILKREALYSIGSTAAAGAVGWLGRSQRGGLLSSQLMSMHSKGAAIAGIASFMGQNLLPGFDKGIYAGTVSSFSSAEILKARVGEITGMSYVRQKLDETLPGISSTGMGILAGGAALVGTLYKLPGEGRYTKFAKHLATDQGTTGVFQTTGRLLSSPNKLDKLYNAWEKVSYNLPYGQDINAYKADVAAGKTPRPTIPYQVENEFFKEQMMSSGSWLKGKAPGTVIPAHVGQYSAETMGRKTQRIFEHLATDKAARFKGVGMGMMAFAAGFITHHMITTGLGIGSIESAESLEKQARGEELIPVRSGRGWGFGGSNWEGGKIKAYVPSMNALIQSDAESKAVWGSDTENISPIERWFRKNFTYDIEMRTAESRPVPITSGAFADVPVIGDILGATIGQIIKPSRLMHSDQFMRVNPETGEPTYLTVPSAMESNPALPIGGTGIGEPIAPSSIGFALSQTQYKLRELQGLVGFAKNVIQEQFTGKETLSPNAPILAESGQITSASDRYWDLELGGGFGMTEVVRRFLPKDRLETRNRYNPLLNNQPSWMPKDLRRGDPMSTLVMGHARVAGAGFESLHPELEGIDPESYPLIYRYMILGDVASYSDEFRETRMKLYGMRKAGILSEDINETIDRVDLQVDEQRKRRNFYQEGPGNADDPEIQRVARNAYFGVLDSVRKLVAPIEYLTPFRPFQKFLPPPRALQDYENAFIYGNEMAMWKPSAAIREFVGPSFLAALRNVGYDFVPPDVQEKREIDEYFDKLTYYKYINLAVQAKESGNYGMAQQYEKFAHKTVYGVNPFGHPLSIYGVLPEAEKSHYDAFSQMTDPRERERLMQILPENQKKIFAAIWSKKDGIADKYKANEGMSNIHMAEYQASGMAGKLKYADYARLQELEEYFSGKQLPHEDWMGWRQSVDIKDVKLKYVTQEGWDVHDFNMWESQQDLLARKPYTEGLEEDIQIDTSTSMIGGFLTQAIGRLNPNASSYSHQLVTRNPNSFIGSSSVTTIRDDRMREIKQLYRERNET